MKIAFPGNNRSGHRRLLCAMSHALVCALPAAAPAQTDAQACLAASHASVEALDKHDATDEYRQLSRCADEACPDLVKEECGRRREALVKQVSLYVFSFANFDSTRQAYVSVDGQLEAPYTVGTPLALSVGRHEVTFRAEGTSFVHPVDVAAPGQTVELELTWPNAPLGVRAVEVPPQRKPAADSWNATKTTAVVLGGVGVASLVVAGGYTQSAIAKRDRAARTCPDVCRTPQDVERWAAAERAGDAATLWATVGWLGFTAGGVLLAVGFYSDDAGEPAVNVGVGPGNFVLTGQF